MAVLAAHDRPAANDVGLGEVSAIFVMINSELVARHCGSDGASGSA
jgi:hypothetical protein